MRTLTTWLVVALAGTALVAGCGGKSASTSNTSTVTTSSAPGGSTSSGGTNGSNGSGGSTAAEGGTASGATGPGATGSTVTQAQEGAIAVSSCKKAIHAETSISSSAKAKLLVICEKAKSGSKADLEKVAHEECVALVEATPLPNAAAKQRALTICKAPA